VLRCARVVTSLPYTALFRSGLGRHLGERASLGDRGVERRAVVGNAHHALDPGVATQRLPDLALGVATDRPLADEVRDHAEVDTGDRKSTRLNSSHVKISYAV